MTKPSKHKLLAEYPSFVRFPIQWGDHDAFGHVNNAVPLRWFESARIRYLEDCDLGHMMSTGGLGPIVASITCNYRRQLVYPDQIDVGARVERIGRSSLVMGHVIVSHQQDAVAIDGQTVVVFFDYDANRPRRVPDDVREMMRVFQGEIPS